MSITAALAEWLCAQRRDGLPGPVRAKEVAVVFDSIGAMVACSQLPEVVAIVKFLQRMGGQPACTMVGHPGRTSLVHAAMANGTMAQYTPMGPQELDRKIDRLVEPRFEREKTMRLRALLKALLAAVSVQPLAVELQAG